MLAHKGQYVPCASKMEDTGIWVDSWQIANLDFAAHLKTNKIINVVSKLNFGIILFKKVHLSKGFFF